MIDAQSVPHGYVRMWKITHNGRQFDVVDKSLYDSAVGSLRCASVVCSVLALLLLIVCLWK